MEDVTPVLEQHRQEYDRKLDMTVNADHSHDPFTPEEPVAPATRKEPAKKQGKYIVLVSGTHDGSTGWGEIGTFEANSQQAAKAQAIKTDDTLRAILENDPAGVTLVAIPKTSWKPSNVSVERTERLRFS